MKKEELLEMRKKKKSKKPAFIRQDAHKKIRLGRSKTWRRPKGRHSKMRLCKAGHAKMPTTGWGTPKEIRHLHKSGLKMVMVCNLKDLTGLKKEEDGVVLSSSMGKKKKFEVIKKAEEMGLKILNIRDTKAYAEKFKKKVEEKKQKRAKKAEAKSKKKAKEKPKKEEKPKATAEASEEDKKKEEKKEKDKILTKKS